MCLTSPYPANDREVEVLGAARLPCEVGRELQHEDGQPWPSAFYFFRRTPDLEGRNPLVITAGQRVLTRPLLKQ
jgi:hypothetical protein